MNPCKHEWIRIYEEFVLGGAFPVGWQCKCCNEFVSNDKLTPAGLPGSISSLTKLVGPHGGKGHRNDGSTYSEQVYDSTTGKLVIK